MPDPNQTSMPPSSFLGQFLDRFVHSSGERMQAQAFQQEQIKKREDTLSGLAQQGVLNPKDPTYQAQTQGLDPHLIATYLSQSNAVKSDRDKFTKAAGQALANGNIKDPKFAATLLQLSAQFPQDAPALKPLIDAWGKSQETEVKGEEARKTQEPKLKSEEKRSETAASARTASSLITAEGANKRNEETIAQRDRAAGAKAEAGHGKAFSAAMKGLTTAIPAAVKADAAAPGSGQAVIDGHNLAALTSPIKHEDFDALARTGLAFPNPSGGAGWVAGVDGWMKAALPDTKAQRMYDQIATKHGSLAAIQTLAGVGALNPDLKEKILTLYHSMLVKFNPQAPDTSGGDSSAEPTPEGSDTGAAEPEPAPADEEPKD